MDNPKRKTRTSSTVKNRYNKKTYRQFATQIKPDLSSRIDAYTKSQGISKPQFLRQAIEALDK